MIFPSVPSHDSFSGVTTARKVSNETISVGILSANSYNLATSYLHPSKHPDSGELINVLVVIVLYEPLTHVVGSMKWRKCFKFPPLNSVLK